MGGSSGEREEELHAPTLEQDQVLVAAESRSFGPTPSGMPLCGCTAYTSRWVQPSSTLDSTRSRSNSGPSLKSAAVAGLPVIAGKIVTSRKSTSPAARKLRLRATLPVAPHRYLRLALQTRHGGDRILGDHRRVLPAERLLELAEKTIFGSLFMLS